MHISPIHKILLPMDGSSSSKKAASFAIDLAHKYSAELVLIHALDISQNLMPLSAYGAAYTKNIDRIVEAATKEAFGWFDQVQKDADALKVNIKREVISAPLSPVAAIVNYAKKNKIDMIVTGSRGRTGFKKLLLGSVAMGLVTYAACPVLVVKSTARLR
jgi:nucleotide-binding universal stress UspA family protein